MGFLGAIAKHLDTIIGPGIMLAYPLYESLRAIETPTSLDDQQWLTYWVLNSFITLFELSCWQVLAWVPIWPYMKILFCMWLVLPVFNGAAYIYGNFVRKYVKIGNSIIRDSHYPESQRKVFEMMNLDTRKSIERYINAHGLDAFDRLIKLAEKEGIAIRFMTK